MRPVIKGDDESQLDSAVDAVIDLSHVPAGSRKGVRGKVKRAVKDHVEPPFRNYEERLERIFDEWIERRLRIIEAIGDLRDAAQRLKSEFEDYEQAYGRGDRIEEVAPPPIDRLLREILQWVSKPFIIYKGEEGLSRGRPRAHVQLTHLIITLLVLIQIAGGKLSYDKNHKNDSEESSLIQALEILRPHLRCLLPDRVPVRAILTAQSIARRGFEAYLRWEESMPIREFSGMLHRKLERQSARERNKNRVV